MGFGESFGIDLLRFRGRFRERIRHRFREGRRICAKHLKKAKEVIVTASSSAVSSDFLKNGMMKLGFLLLALGGILLLYYLYLLLIKNRHKFYLVGTVSKIKVYPVTSCTGISQGTAECTTQGLFSGNVMDREFFIGVKGAKNTVDLYKSSTLAKMKVLSDQKHMIMAAPKGTQFKISMDEIRKTTSKSSTLNLKDMQLTVNDCGESVSNYLTTSFQSDKKLGLYNFNKLLSNTKRKMGYVMIPRSSVEEANSWLNLNPPLTEDYFRPNIVIKDSVPLDEENWEMIRIGPDVTFKVEKLATTFLEDNYSEEDKEYVQELPPYKPVSKALFAPGSSKMMSIGVIATLEKGGLIKVGDEVAVQYKRKTLHME